MKILRRVMNMPEEEWVVLSKACRDWMEKYYNPQFLVKRWDSEYDTIFEGARS